MDAREPTPADDFLAFATPRRNRYATILADPPWRFPTRTSMMAPEHRRLSRYGMLTTADIATLPVLASPQKWRTYIY